MTNRTIERRLPVGVTEFEQLVSDLKAEYGDTMPTNSDDDIKFAISSTIMHMGPKDSHASLESFYKTLVAGAAKQVAHYIFQETKLKQQQRAADEQAAAAAKEVSNEPNPQG